jgi:twinkle protein
VCMTTVCHLRKPSGQAFEEGGQISLSHLRGSGALYQLADTVIGFERNQQHPNKDTANTMGVRLLKDRFGGNTGLKVALRFDDKINRLIQVDLKAYEDALKDHNE